jgi:hypothetical protein
MYGEIEVKLHSFLFLAPEESEWSCFRSDHLNPEEEASCAHSIVEIWKRGLFRWKGDDI